jgi:hypothetical protein
VIACDTSSLIAFLQDAPGDDVETIDKALRGNQLVLPPAVLAEVLSSPATAPAIQEIVSPLPLLEPQPGYWARVGAARAALASLGLKARLADALIAQSCIDGGVPLITRDKDFRHFAAHCGLTLA